MNIGNWLTEVRRQRPLVHNITNLVVNNIVANTLLAIGASPVMAYALEEVADMAGIAQALALNMGTLTPDLVAAMQKAGEAANAAGVPVIFDPVGVGATPYRNETAALIADSLRLTVLRGNAGEIGFMTHAGGTVSGVDSSGASEQLPIMMKQYAQDHLTLVIATGEQDLISDGTNVWQLSNGHAWQSRMTGSGCALTGILGAFLGAAGRQQPLSIYADAAIAAVTCLNVAAESAAQSSHGPGSFAAALLDALYALTPEIVNARAQVELMEITT